MTALTNGNYVVGSPYWDNGAVADAGAVTWELADGAKGRSPPITACWCIAAGGGYKYELCL